MATTRTTQADLPARLREESAKLDLEFRGRVPAEVVTRCIQTAQARIAAAQIPDFAPIIFVRHARRLLRDSLASDAAATAPG